LTNAIRHAQAENITIELREEPRHASTVAEGLGILISLRVSDDGVGLKPGVPAGFGLSAMRERVLSAGGSLAVETQIPRGTALAIKIPAQPSEQKRLLVSEAPRIMP
jgi:two-component system sensor histidine kinase UhpB